MPAWCASSLCSMLLHRHCYHLHYRRILPSILASLSTVRMLAIFLALRCLCHRTAHASRSVLMGTTAALQTPDTCACSSTHPDRGRSSAPISTVRMPRISLAVRCLCHRTAHASRSALIFMTTVVTITSVMSACSSTHPDRGRSSAPISTVRMPTIFLATRCLCHRTARASRSALI